MTSSEKFCLRWNDFESNISVAFREIREEKDFFDCTLSCGSRQIQAHKLILSACSPFFKSILRQNPHQHPLLYLKGVDFTGLQAVLDFMYHGEVNVAQEELNSFLAVAEDLKVKGLTQNNAADTKPQNSFRPETAKPHMGKQMEKTEQQTLLKKLRLAPPPVPRETPVTYHDDVDIQEVVPVKTEPVSLPAETPPPTFHSIPHVNVQEDYSAAHLGEMGSGVGADHNQEVMQVIKQEPQAEPLPPTQQPMGVMTHFFQQQTLLAVPNPVHPSNIVAQIPENRGDDGNGYGGYGEEDQYEGILMNTGGFTCDMCGALSRTSDFLGKLDDVQQECKEESSDVQSHTVNELSCPICLKQFDRKAKVKRHVSTVHSKPLNLQCGVCLKENFKHMESLQTHLRKIHQILEVPVGEAAQDNFNKSEDVATKF